MVVAAGYGRLAADCTATSGDLIIAPYVPPSLAVLVLVVTPGAWRVPASLTVAAVTGVLTLALRSGAYGLDRELIVSFRHLWSARRRGSDRMER